MLSLLILLAGLLGAAVMDSAHGPWAALGVLAGTLAIAGAAKAAEQRRGRR